MQRRVGDGGAEPLWAIKMSKVMSGGSLAETLRLTALHRTHKVRPNFVFILYILLQHLYDSHNVI